MARLLTLAFCALTLVACEDDDAPAEDILSLDGPNLTGPILEAGTHRFAVQFYPEDLEPFEGQNLATARIFVGQAPESMRISVHAGGTTAPGIELAALNVGNFGTTRRFIDYDIGPVPIVADDFLWIVAEVELAQNQQSIGCDAGPAVEGGDWLWSSDRYLPYTERTTESVNWNIRGVVE